MLASAKYSMISKPSSTNFPTQAVVYEAILSLLQNDLQQQHLQKTEIPNLQLLHRFLLFEGEKRRQVKKTKDRYRKKYELA